MKKKITDQNAITFNPKGGGADFVLNADSAWLTVDGFSIWIRRSQNIVKCDGAQGTRRGARPVVFVEAFRKGREASGDPLQSFNL